MDIDAESAALGALILDGDAMADTQLTVADFYRPAHATIFGAMQAMFAAGDPIDAITLLDKLGALGEAQRVGGGPYLHTLISMVPTVAHGPHYADIVRDKAVRRRLAQVGARITQLAHSESDDADELLASANVALSALTDGAVSDEDPILLEQLLQPTMDEVELIGQTGQRGLLSPWADLNAIVNPLRGGTFGVIAARPAVGKSVVALDFCRTAAAAGITTLLCSMEMPRLEVVQRVLSADCRIPLTRLLRGTLEDEDWTRFVRGIDRLSALPMFIDDRTNMSVPLLRAKMHRMRARHGPLGLVVIDYMQLLISPSRVENRQVAIADFSRGLKLLAKEFDCVMIALSQLNRNLEQRTDKRPQLSDLRESGAIEQDADLVLLLHREDMYDKESPRTGEMDIIVAKQRNGPTGVAAVAFQGGYARTSDLARPWTDK